MSVRDVPLFEEVDTFRAQLLLRASVVAAVIGRGFDPVPKSFWSICSSASSFCDEYDFSRLANPITAITNAKRYEVGEICFMRFMAG